MSLEATGVPAKQHQKSSNGLSSAHERDRRQTDRRRSLSQYAESFS